MLLASNGLGTEVSISIPVDMFDIFDASHVQPIMSRVPPIHCFNEGNKQVDMLVHLQ